MNSDGSLYELDKKYPIECIRKENDLYRVYFLGEDYIAVITFDKSGNNPVNKSDVSGRFGIGTLIGAALADVKT